MRPSVFVHLDTLFNKTKQNRIILEVYQLCLVCIPNIREKEIKFTAYFQCTNHNSETILIRRKQ